MPSLYISARTEVGKPSLANVVPTPRSRPLETRKAGRVLGGGTPSRYHSARKEVEKPSRANVAPKPKSRPPETRKAGGVWGGGTPPWKNEH